MIRARRRTAQINEQIKISALLSRYPGTLEVSGTAIYGTRYLIT
jgi:hypothetical protein